MKRKRLDRDGWGFQHFPYYQMRVELPEFCGVASLIEIRSGEDCSWHMPRAGRVPVCGRGMMWLQLIPEGRYCVITAKYRRKRWMEKLPRVSVWYADVIDQLEYDPDGVAAFVDQYLDVIFSPQGDVHIDDRDELDAALRSGELTTEMHARALAEGEWIVQELCADVRETERRCAVILRHVLARLGEKETLRRNVRKDLT